MEVNAILLEHQVTLNFLKYCDSNEPQQCWSRVEQQVSELETLVPVVDIAF